MSQEYKIPVWKINGLELPFDFEDENYMERYARAFEHMKESAKNEPKTGMRHEYIHFYCDVYYQLFDELFGRGTSDKLFNGQRNMRLCDEVFDSFLKFVRSTMKASQDYTVARKQYYRNFNRPQPNRQKKKRRYN